MTGTIIVTTIGLDTGPFNIYSNLDGYLTAFDVNISRAQLLAGYTTSNIPDGTTKIKVQSYQEPCYLYIEIDLDVLLCYKLGMTISPNYYYFTDIIVDGNQTYVYGTFNQYLNGTDWYPEVRLIRLNEDRTLDESFDMSTGGPNQVLYTGSSIFKQSDGKLILTGTFTTYKGTAANRIIRINNDGSIDGTFIYGTGFNNLTQSPGIDSLDRIIVPGKFNNYNGNTTYRIARLSSTGTFDATFVTGSGFNNTTVDVLVNADDGMYVTGYFNTYNGTGGLNGIVKLTSTGAIDGTFSSGTGFFPYLPEQPNYMARIPGETSFIVAGAFTSYNGNPYGHIIKLTSTGAVDATFAANSGTGFDGNTYALGVNIIWGDKILVYGDFFTNYNGTPAFSAAVLNPDGTLYYAPTVYYYYPFPIGNIFYGAGYDECLVPIHTFDPSVTTSTSSTSTSSTSTTSTTTAIPLTTTSTTTLALTEYCYEGNYECGDPLHEIPGHEPDTGSVTYFNEFGTSVTNYYCLDDGVISIYASSTPTKIGMISATCPPTENCYIIESCSKPQTLYYASMTNGCIFGSTAVLSSSWSVGQYVQFIVGTGCPTASTQCGNILGTSVTAPTAIISSNTKPSNCYDGMCL